MKIKKSSWHYRYLFRTGKCPDRMKTHCEYWAALVLTPLSTLLMWLFAAAIVAFMLWILAAGFVVMVVHPVLYLSGVESSLGLEIDKNAAKVAAFLWVLMGGAIAIGVALVWLSDKKSHVVVAYRDWRNKTCTRIDFED